MIFLTLILGLGLRLISLNQSLWLDEATSALTTKMNLADFFGRFMPGDFHPPLYYLALRAWGTVFGTSEVALRGLSLLFGIATIYIVYLIGKKLINKETGIITSLLLATSGLHIYYSQEARMYAMSTFLVMLLVYLFMKILHEKRVENWIAFCITLGLLAMTDYLPLLVLVPIWIFAILQKKDINWWKRFLTSHIILAVFAVIWFPIFSKQLTSGINVTSTSPAWVSVLGTFSVKDILLIPTKFAIGRVSLTNKKIYYVLIALVTILFGGLIYKSKRYFKEIRLIYLWLFIPLVLALIISVKIPVLNYFRFLFVLPAFYLILAAGINNIGKWRAITLFLVVALNLITSFMYLTNKNFQREDWRGAVSFIEEKKSEGDIIIFPANSQMEAYRYYAPKALIYGPEAVNPFHEQIWLIRYAQAISDPNDETREKVEKLGYDKKGEYDFNGVSVWLYGKSN